jgi:hypothetical protein
MQYLTHEQKHAELIGTYGASSATPDLVAILWTLAALELEEERLQAFVDEHGTTYAVMGDRGQSYTKPRPEWQQLDRTRGRKLAALTKVRHAIRGGVEELDPELEALFG